MFKINGNVVLVEGGVVKNLTLDSSANLPESPSLAKVFSLKGNANVPDGIYHYDGSDWQNIPTLDYIKLKINERLSSGKFGAYRTIFNTRTYIGSATANSDRWVSSSAPLYDIATGLTVRMLSMLWFDPTEHAIGAKFRLRIITNVNAVGSSKTTTTTVGLCKVARPTSASAGISGAVVYSIGSPDIIQMDFIDLPAASSLVHESADFSAPSEAGMYAFHVMTDGTIVSGDSSTTHFDISIQVYD